MKADIGHKIPQTTKAYMPSRNQDRYYRRHRSRHQIMNSTFIWKPILNQFTYRFC